MNRLGTTLALCLLATHAPAALEPNSRDPYVGAIVLDAHTGDILFEDNADRTAYPASVVKLLHLLVCLEAIDQGEVRLQDPVPTSAESARMGGSQVYLDVKEQFPMDELLYALVVKSANDAAVALAEHVAGSKPAFVGLMNRKARMLGMTHSAFHSVHGLPPSAGQSPDTTTARDIGRLCFAAVQEPDIFPYTSTRERGFRNNAFHMKSHNPLLYSVEGCDGLKTGYYRAAGFSIAATAQRGPHRVIVVVLGSRTKAIRNQRAADLMERGFQQLQGATP